MSFSPQKKTYHYSTSKHEISELFDPKQCFKSTYLNKTRITIGVRISVILICKSGCAPKLYGSATVLQGNSNLNVSERRRVLENVYGKERISASRTESPETSVGDPDPYLHVFGPPGFKSEDNVPAGSYKEKYEEEKIFFLHPSRH
jgi:hypothetical protein